MTKLDIVLKLYAKNQHLKDIEFTILLKKKYPKKFSKEPLDNLRRKLTTIIEFAEMRVVDTTGTLKYKLDTVKKYLKKYPDHNVSQLSRIIRKSLKNKYTSKTIQGWIRNYLHYGEI